MNKPRHYRRRVTRTISAICTGERFREFYKSLMKLCTIVKVKFTKRLKANLIRFEISVVY